MRLVPGREALLKRRLSGGSDGDGIAGGGVRGRYEGEGGSRRRGGVGDSCFCCCLLLLLLLWMGIEVGRGGARLSANVEW